MPRDNDIPSWNSILLNERLSGRVKWFNRIKGYGFIIADGMPDEVFVHFSQIVGEGYRNLYEGDRVTFDLHKGSKGLAAKNVRASEGYVT